MKRDIWNRCDECGRFISYEDFGNGAINNLIHPDTEFTCEKYETLCKACMENVEGDMQVTTNFKSGMGGKKKPATYAERKHMDAVAKMRCVITGRYNPVLHHCFCDRITRYAGRRAPHFDVIPIWQGIHQGALGHGDEIAIHRDKLAWVKLHGPDWSYTPKVYEAIYGRGDITHDEITEYWQSQR
jgi:ribosomal protein S14